MADALDAPGLFFEETDEDRETNRGISQDVLAETAKSIEFIDWTCWQPADDSSTEDPS